MCCCYKPAPAAADTSLSLASLFVLQVITQVKIVNIGQGVTPLRVLSMRWLDEQNENDHAAPPTAPPDPHRLNEEEQVGEWASLEVSFAYRAQPSSSSARSKAKNANLLVHFYMGMNGFFGAPIRMSPLSVWRVYSDR